MSRGTNSNELDLDGVVERIVQLFREVQNTLPQLSAQLQALSNITQQKKNTQEAARRHRVLKQNGHNRFNNFWTPSLGILTHFSDGLTEEIVAQHSADQAALVGAVFSTKQKWTDRAQKMARYMEGVETAVTSRSGPLSPHALQVSHGLHGIAAAVIKMETALQEIVIALRRDYQLCATESQDFAEALSEVLHQSLSGSDALVPAFAWKDEELFCDSRVPNVSPFCPLRLEEAIEQLDQFISSRWTQYSAALLNNQSLLLLS